MIKSIDTITIGSMVSIISLLTLTACNNYRPQIDAEEPLYFISPNHGDSVKSPVVVRFGLNGIGVAPAGVERDNTGHHHLIIDAPLPDLKVPIPANRHYIHFGNGQTQTTIELAPGKHSLQLLLGNAYHIPHSEPLVSKQITITVVE